MLKAVLHGSRGVLVTVGSVHRLKEAMPEGKMRDVFWLQSFLWIHKFELVAARKDERRASLRAHAHPVQICRSCDGPIGLDRDAEGFRVEGFDCVAVELEQRFTARAHDES